MSNAASTRKRKKSLNKECVTACIIVGVMTFLCLLPLWVALINSFGVESDITLNGFALFPRKFTLENYRFMLNNKGNMVYRAFGVTGITVAMGTIYTMVITVCFAYAIAQDRKVFPFANILSFLAWFTTVFSGGVIPWYILCAQTYGLKNNLFALFIPSGMSAMHAFILKSNFKAVPGELVESAKIDGASNLTIFLKIALPLSKVGLVTVGLFTVLGYWNDFHLSLYLITNSTLYTVQKMLYSMMSNISALVSGSITGQEAGAIPLNTAKMVMTVLSVVPITVAFPFAQKYFVKGITIGAVKG